LRLLASAELDDRARLTFKGLVAGYAELSDFPVLIF
jgi:hypothetical protein